MEVVILGIGNYSEVIIELCQEVGHTVVGLYHFNSTRNGEEVLGYKIKGNYQDFILSMPCNNVVVAVGNNEIRNEWLSKLRKLEFNTISLIHPLAYISPSATVGRAVYIHAHSFVWTKAFLYNDVIISPKAVVAHHVSIGEACHISASSTIGAYVQLESNVTVGINAGIISKPILIGAGSIIGANSMIIDNVEKNSIMVGTPGRKNN